MGERRTRLPTRELTSRPAAAGLRIAFVHPELGIGGSERLVLDAAAALGSAGHRVTVFTAARDPVRSFEAARDGTVDVRVRGGFVPAAIFRRLRAPCAIARMHYAASALLVGEKFDLIFVDLVAHVIPFLRLVGVPVVFYCHYPDRLLTPPRRGLYRAYRAPLDRWEEIGTGMASRVLVNSRFTAQAFHRTFPRLHGIAPEVVYPGIEVESAAPIPAPSGEQTVVAFNRYERHKNALLVVEAFARLRSHLSPAQFSDTRLVIAGGYDERWRASREIWNELEARAAALRVAEQVTLLKSVGEDDRRSLLARCACVLHATENEHFGYVPVEAMAAARPVIAVDSGGPRETIIDGETGFLCPPSADAFAQRLSRLLLDRGGAAAVGDRARAHVIANFSRAGFRQRLQQVVAGVVDHGVGAGLS